MSLYTSKNHKNCLYVCLNLNITSKISGSLNNMHSRPYLFCKYLAFNAYICYIIFKEITSMEPTKNKLDLKVTIALSITGLSWLALSVFIFIFLKEPFEFLKLVTYLLWSGIIGAYAYFLILRKPFFSSIFFIAGYLLSFYALYYNAIHNASKVSSYFVIFICMAVLISFSAVGYLLDRNQIQKKKLKEYKHSKK